MTGRRYTLHEDQYTFSIISCSYLLRMRNVSGKSCRESQNTHFIFNKFSKIVKFMRYMWKNPVELDRLQMNTWSVPIACWMTKATDTQNIWYLLLFHCKNSSMNTPHCYVICTLPVLFSIVETIVSTTLQKRVWNFSVWGNIKNIALPFMLFTLEQLFWLFRKKYHVEKPNK